jgi:uncharacterized OB-fold protein
MSGGGENKTTGGGENKTTGGGENKTTGGGENKTTGGGENKTTGGGEGRPVREGLFRVGDDGVVELIGGWCCSCSRHHFPRAAVCPYCSAVECEEKALRGPARLWLYTAVMTRPPGFRGTVPFGFGVVELAEGLRVVTRLSESDPKRLRPGMAMQLAVDDLYTDEDGERVFGYVFAPEA